MAEQETRKFSCLMLFALAMLVARGAHAQVSASTIIAIPGGESGIGFDDIQFSPQLKSVIIPAAQTGAIYLINPVTLVLQAITGFTAASGFHGGHGEGVTSADAGGGFIFATDRSSQMLDVIDTRSHKLVGSAKLAGGPDYVRYVGLTHEVWVTEPRDKRIEIFSFVADKPSPTHSTYIEIAGGPESLTIDEASKRAFTNLWTDSTVAIDLKSHAELARWINGCSGSRGIALDAAREFLFVGCKEGKLQVLDAKSGKHLGEAASGEGVDIIAYNPALAHVYLPGAKSATMATIAISPSGTATVLGTTATAHGAHCATADDSGKVYVCDPAGGKILVFKDNFR